MQVGRRRPRTRNQWDAFYEQIGKKPVQENDDVIVINGVENQDFHKKNENPCVIVDTEDTDDFDADEEYKVVNTGKNLKRTRKVEKPLKKKARFVKDEELIDVLDSMLRKKKEPTLPVVENKVQSDIKGTNLPLKFRFDDDQKMAPPEKTEGEKEIDSLFDDLQRGLWESEDGFMNNSSVNEIEDADSIDNDQSPEACCRRGDHDSVLDEQIGLICRHCSAEILNIKYVLPPFYEQSPVRRERNDFEGSNNSTCDSLDHIHLERLNCSNVESCCIAAAKTVKDLIPESQKELYPHQIQGFEFLWRNIAGDIHIENLEKLSDNGNGCIISHAPGTGKTRLIIVFLQTFLKLYPDCLPVIVAPPGILLTWEDEFRKWNVDIKFHNLNETKLSGHEAEIAESFFNETGGHVKKNNDYARIVKLGSWIKGGGVLGIGYQLFERLAGEHVKNRLNESFRKMLLEYPGLLVLDEGHTPRNNQSLMWKALTKVETRRRIILSGTPFQNNFTELYNTLSLMNPELFQQIVSTNQKGNVERGEWVNLMSSINKDRTDDSGLRKLRKMMEPFVHIHKGGILEKTLPGMKNSLILLRPTDFQKELQPTVTRVSRFLKKNHLESIISVHPSTVAGKTEFSVHKRKLEKLASVPNAGVKTRFLINLIKLATCLGEKVLVFSQYIDPLLYIKKLLKSYFGWNEGREVIYMDGKLKLKQRQHSINSFNEKEGNAKVLLASERACSEGINLVGASRVVLLDVVWNPSVERQAISRAYRLGQERVVYVYHLVTAMELDKYAKQAEKERISKLIFSGENGGKSCCSGDEVVWEDKVLESMVQNDDLRGIFEKIVHQPKESDLVENFGFVDINNINIEAIDLK